jgi:hypothetical protein
VQGFVRVRFFVEVLFIFFVAVFQICHVDLHIGVVPICPVVSQGRNRLVGGGLAWDQGR